MRKWRLLLVLALAAAATAACSRRPADPVSALLADLERAAEDRDPTAFGERLSASFRDEHGLDRDGAIRQLKQWFAGYETVRLEVYAVEADRSLPGAARVRCVVEFSGQGRRLLGLEGLLPPSAAYRFELDVADEGGTWRVRGASYEPIERAEPPAGDAGR